jgi:hypothetical protein
MNRSGCVPAAPRVGLAHAVAHQHTDCWLVDQAQLIGRGRDQLRRFTKSADYRVTFWKYGGRSFLVSLRISTMAWRSASDSAARYRGSCASPDNTSHKRL